MDTRSTWTAGAIAGALSLTIAMTTPGKEQPAEPPPAPANPFVAQGTGATQADRTTWRARMTTEARERATGPDLAAARATAEARLPSRGGTLRWAEDEPGDRAGRNDVPARAERIHAFGTRRGHTNAVRVVGRTAAPGEDGPRTELPQAVEDNGSIDSAVDSGLRGPGTVTTTGVLGDGPHGPSGDGTNDVDFYAVTLPAGHQLVVDTSGSEAAAAAGAVVYDAAGDVRAIATQPGSTPGTSRLTFTPRKPGRYFVMVAGSAVPSPFPADPFDPGSGTGGAATGDYALSLQVRESDTDQYAVRLRPGDVLGAVVSGSADTVRVTAPGGKELVGTTRGDFSSLYPKSSPLPGGGNATVAHVARTGGWYAVSADGAPGRYELRVEAYRPGTEADTRPQTILLDFDGGRVDTRPFRGPGVRTLTPFAGFLDGWDIPRGRADAMTRAITRQVRAALVHEVEHHGSDPDLAVRVVSSRTHARLRGARDVTRVVVAGTTDEAGVATLGTSETIDPGNFGTEDSALVLLDLLSAPAGRQTSLNTWMTRASHRERFVAQAVGNVAAHEAAHTLGSFHTDNRRIDQLMDSGDAGDFGGIFGVGPDGVGGTRDDVDLELGVDGYAAREGFTGEHDTTTTTRWAFAGR
jgi:hypothetical protein